MEPLHAFAELGRIRFSETSFDDVCRQVIALARRVLPGADEVSITRLRARLPDTPASTSEVARRLDEVQYERLSGPCLEAAAQDTTVAVADTAAEARWPEWAAVASAAGISSSLSVSLPIGDDVRGALNVYSRRGRSFPEVAVTPARTFADHAAVALANADTYDAATVLAIQLRQAMENRAVIEQAKGIVMAERRCTADEAFGVLTKVSQDSNRKLREVAAALVARTGGPGSRPGVR